MTKQEAQEEIKRVSKLMDVSKDRYQRHGFDLVKVETDKNYNEFKSDCVDKGKRRYK